MNNTILVQLKTYLHNHDMNLDNITEILNTIDRQKHYRIFEFVSAFINELVMWENLSPDILESRNALRYRKIFPDYGIDCASNDLQTVLQAKWYSPNGKVSFKNLSTFICYAEKIIQSQELIVSTSQNVKLHSLSKQLKTIKYNTINDNIILETCIQALNYETENNIDQEEIVLREYQKTAIENCVNEIDDRNSKIIRIKMACGTGKSIVVGCVLKELCDTYVDSTKYCVMVPSKILLQQMHEKLLLYFDKSDIGLVYDKKCIIDKRITICVYNSVYKIKDLEFHVVFVDEGHHIDDIIDIVSNEEKDEEEKEEENKDSYLYEMCRLNTHKFVLTSATLSKDNPYIYEYTTEQAITDKYLVDYDIVIPYYEEMQGDKQPSLAKLIRDNLGIWTRILAYCNSREEAQRFCEILKNCGVKSAYMDGSWSLPNRMQVIKDFENGKFHVLVTVNILAEGIDIPCADVCMFVEPRCSSTNIIQCVGRVLRLYKDKTMGHVIIPTSHDVEELSKFMKAMSMADKRIGNVVRNRSNGRAEVINMVNDNTSIKELKIYITY